MSVLHLPQAQGVLQRLFKLSCSLPFVCLYFSLGCDFISHSWSSFCRALSASVSSLVLCLQEADPSCCTLWCLPPVKWPQASARKSFMGRGFNFFTVWGCLQLLSACSNLLVHHPQLPGFCVPVLWSAWRVKSMWSLISVYLCLCRVVLCWTECLNSYLMQYIIPVWNSLFKIWLTSPKEVKWFSLSRTHLTSLCNFILWIKPQSLTAQINLCSKPFQDQLSQNLNPEQLDVLISPASVTAILFIFLD